MQVTRAMKHHLVTRDNWQLVHRIYRHATSACAESATTIRSFQPRETDAQAAATVEQALGYCFSDAKLKETALTHSCAPLTFFFFVYFLATSAVQLGACASHLH